MVYVKVAILTLQEIQVNAAAQYHFTCKIGGDKKIIQIFRVLK